jgi:hypothetical protein
VIERLGPWSALLVVVCGKRVREHVAGGDFDAVAVPALGQKCPGGRVDGRALEDGRAELWRAVDESAGVGAEPPATSRTCRIGMSASAGGQGRTKECRASVHRRRDLFGEVDVIESRGLLGASLGPTRWHQSGAGVRGGALSRPTQGRWKWRCA